MIKPDPMIKPDRLTDSVDAELDMSRRGPQPVIKLLVSNIGPDVTEQMMQGYFESRNVEVVHVSPPSAEERCRTVFVTRLKDVETFCARNHKIKQYDVKIKPLPDEVDNPDTIEVLYAPESFSKDTLEVYFTGPLSGEKDNEEDKSIEWMKMIEPGRCRIKFKSSKDAVYVLAKKRHTFMKKELIVTPVPVKLESMTPPTNPDELSSRSGMKAEFEKIKRDTFTKSTLDLLIAKYSSSKYDILDGLEAKAVSTSCVDWSNGIIELLPNTDAALPDLESATAQLPSSASSTVCRADIHFPPEASYVPFKATVQFSSNNNLPVDLSMNNCIAIAGKLTQIRDLEKMVHDLCVPVSDQIQLSHEDCVYISKYAIKIATKAHPGVKIEINGTTKMMSVSGAMYDVSRFKESLNGLTTHATVPVRITKLAIEFLKDSNCMILQTLIKHDSIIPFFFEDLFDGHSLSLLCPHADAQYAENVSSTISVTILEKNFEFPQYFFTDVADSPRFSNFKQKMIERYAFHCAVGNGVLKLICHEEIQKQLSELFCKFVVEEYSITERIPVKRGIWRLFNSWMEKKWNELEAEMMKNGIEILSKSKPTASEPYLEIKGDRNTVAQKKEKFIELQKSVHELKLTDSCLGIVQHFSHTAHGIATLTGVETTTKAFIELEVQKDDPESSSTTPTTGKVSSFKKVCTANTQGITVNLYVGDITKFNKAEVIVNAANEDLVHNAGVAKAILDKGGPDIAKDSQDYVNKKGKVPTGSAVIFHRVGNLPPPYQAIVHAVGPRWSLSYGTSDSKDRNISLLCKTVKNSLEQAKSFNSIAIPAISSGVFGFPIDIATDSLVQGVVEFVTSKSDSNLSDINFVIFDDNVAAFKKAITDKKHFQNVHMFNEAPQPFTITKTTPSTASQSPSQMKGAFSKIDTSISFSSAQRSKRRSKASVLNRIKIIKDADILKYQCEVLISITDEQLRFGGSASRVLLKVAAGQGLEDECQSIPMPIQYGNIVTTKAYQLESKHIIHVALPEYSGSTDSETVLKSVVNKCLQECTRLNAKSVSIPSIGAGNLKYPSDVVAMCLLDEAFRYLSDNDGRTSLQLIYFIISNGTVHKEFQQYYSQMLSSNSDTSDDDVSDSSTSSDVAGMQPFSRSVSSSSNTINIDVSGSTSGDVAGIRPFNRSVSSSSDTSDDDVSGSTGGDDDVSGSTGGDVAGMQPFSRSVSSSSNTINVDVSGSTTTSGDVAEIRPFSRSASTVKLKTNSPPASSSRPSDVNSCSFALPNGIHLHLTQGDITDERTDVIVNTTNPELKLIGWGVSGALLKKGGSGLQDACDQIASNMRAAEGKVVETKCEGIGQLRCKSIFHVVFKGKDQRKLVKTILACLDRAEKMKYTSIAIPAIGTGTVAYPSALVAEGIVKALKQFTQKKPNHVKEIRMVIFKLDMFKEFTDAFKKIKMGSDEGLFNYIHGKFNTLLKSKYARDCQSGDNTRDNHMDSNVDNEKGNNDLVEHNHDSNQIDTEVTICIYGETEHVVRSAEEMLKNILDTLIVTEEVDDPNISELSSVTLSELKKFARHQKVDMDINNDPLMHHTIRLHGCLNDVLKVKDRVRDALCNLVKPPWVPMPNDSNGREVTVHLVTLNPSDAEYIDTLYKFDVTMKSRYTQIVSIQRIQNPGLFDQYMVQKREMEKRNPPNFQNERWLFHGTKASVTNAINTQGFNRIFKRVTVYGHGVYFASDASYSDDFCKPDSKNHHHMYLVRVLTGEFTVGKKTMLVPPAKNHKINKDILWDSTVNKECNPSIFAVYKDSQSYPAYLITYTKSLKK